MKNILCIIKIKHILFVSSIFLLNSCKQPQEGVPAPLSIAAVSFSIAADSVKLNPYGYTPLAALINFSTAIAGQAFVRVKGKHGRLTNVEHTFNDKGTHHSIPVIGLYANYANTVDIRILNTSGDTLAKCSLTIQTGDLPPNMPTLITAMPFDESRVAPGLILVSSYSTFGTSSPSTPYFMDAYGDIRWVLDYRSHLQLKSLSFDDGIDRLKNGNFFFGDTNPNLSKIYEVDLLGQVINDWSMPGYLFHHNVSEKPNGNFVVTVTKPGSMNTDGLATIEDYVVEIDRQEGGVVTEWDLKQSLDEHRQALPNDPADWFHGNAVEYDSTDNTIIVSGRTQGVVKLDYQNKVKWILSAHRGWTTNRRGEDLTQFLLKPVDASGHLITDPAVADGSTSTDDFEWNWYQHSNIFLPNGDIMLFDDGSVREFNSSIPPYSRAVSYKIDPVNRTVQQTWAYGKERGLETFSNIVSSVQFLAQTNHVLFGPGYQVQNTTGQGGKVVEVDFASKQVVSEISISSANKWGFHRAKKMSAYP